MIINEFPIMTLKERGHYRNGSDKLFFSSFRYFPITKIIIQNNKIDFIRKGKIFSYQWEQIKNPIIKSREIYKGYGGYVFAKIVKKSFHCDTTDGNHYEFDVSDSFPDFKNNKELLATLEENLDIFHSHLEKYKDNISALFMIGFILILMAFYSTDKKFLHFSSYFLLFFILVFIFQKLKKQKPSK